MRFYFFIGLIATALTACKEETSTNSTSTMTEFFSFSSDDNNTIQARRHSLTIVDNKTYGTSTPILGGPFEDDLIYALSSDALTSTSKISSNTVFRSYIESDSDTFKAFYLASNNQVKDIKLEQIYEVKQLSGEKISENILLSGGDIQSTARAMAIIDQKDTLFPVGAACTYLKQENINKNYISFVNKPTSFNTLDQWQANKNQFEITNIINGSYQNIAWKEILYKNQTNYYPTAVLLNGKIYEGSYILAKVPYRSEGTGCHLFNVVAANAISDALKSLYD